MNITSPILKGAAHAAALPGDSVASFLKMVADTTGLFADDSSDGVIGMMMSGLAGVATALAVAIVLTVYFRSRYRSVRDVLRHGFAAAAVFALVAFVAYDMRRAALAYLGINPTKPAVEFEIRLPKTAASAISGNTQVELHTDRNQTLAQLQGQAQGQAQGAPAADADGLTVLRGSVPLDYRTSERVVILNLPGLASCEFKLRLPASPTPSDQFGPWHLADRVASPVTGEETRSQQHDAFAIRYRVL
ncbi:MAG: acriflavin resistance protein [Bradyrhizobium sp.]